MIVLVAGPIASGKTAFSRALAQRTGADRVSVRQALFDALGSQQLNRAELQTHGADLDRRTAGRWLLHFVQERSETTPNLIVDSLRTRRQTLPLLSALPACVLVYLQAHESVRRKRYLDAAAEDAVKAALPYAVATNHPTERQVTELKPLADLVLEVDEITAAEAADQAISALKLSSSP